MKVTPIAADSLGARSMCTLVETRDCKVLIDPSVRLGPWRYDLPPHPTEKEKERSLWREIKTAAKTADVLTVSHYHYDHHNPDAPSLYRKKHAYLKDGKRNTNRSQAGRAAHFLAEIRKYPERIAVADGHEFEHGRTLLRFSKAVPHGLDTELGCVVMLSVREGDRCVVHTSDVTGPPLAEHVAFILQEDPDVLICDGPLAYMIDQYGEKNVRRSEANLVRILEGTRVKTLVLEHHLARALNWKAVMPKVFTAAEAAGARVVNAAEFLGRKVEQLEARRYELYGVSPGAPPLNREEA